MGKKHCCPYCYPTDPLIIKFQKSPSPFPSTTPLKHLTYDRTRPSFSNQVDPNHLGTSNRNYLSTSNLQNQVSKSMRNSREIITHPKAQPLGDLKAIYDLSSFEQEHLAKVFAKDQEMKNRDILRQTFLKRRLLNYCRENGSVKVPLPEASPRKTSVYQQQGQGPAVQILSNRPPLTHQSNVPTEEPNVNRTTQRNLIGTSDKVQAAYGKYQSKMPPPFLRSKTNLDQGFSYSRQQVTRVASNAHNKLAQNARSNVGNVIKVPPPRPPKARHFSEEVKAKTNMTNHQGNRTSEPNVIRVGPRLEDGRPTLSKSPWSIPYNTDTSPTAIMTRKIWHNINSKIKIKLTSDFTSKISSKYNCHHCQIEFEVNKRRASDELQDYTMDPIDENTCANCKFTTCQNCREKLVSTVEHGDKPAALCAVLGLTVRRGTLVDSLGNGIGPSESDQMSGLAPDGRSPRDNWRRPAIANSLANHANGLKLNSNNNNNGQVGLISSNFGNLGLASCIMPCTSRNASSTGSFSSKETPNFDVKPRLSANYSDLMLSRKNWLLEKGFL